LGFRVSFCGFGSDAQCFNLHSYGGKLQRIERQIHHYGSGLNAQVLLAAFRDNPSDSYLLRAGYAGSLGSLSNVNQDGFPSAAFHSWPDTLKWDGITGDYGGGFLGMALSSGTYVADDKDLGIVAYGGILKSHGNSFTVMVRGPVRRRIFVGPLSVLVEVDVGEVQEFSFNVVDGTLSLTVGQTQGVPHASQVVIWVTSTAGDVWSASSQEKVVEDRGGWVMSLGKDAATVELSRS
jgi:hypothetical protein